MKPARQTSLEWGNERSINPWIPPDLLTVTLTTSIGRRELRYIVNQPAQLAALGDDGGVWQVRIRNITPDGMQLVSETPILAPPDVRIRWNGRDVRGTIRYNHKYGAGMYRIGIELAARSDELMRELLMQEAEELSSANRALRGQARLAQQYASLLDLTSEAIVVLSSEGAVFFWNQAAERLYGWTRAEALGRKLQQFVPTEPALNLADPQSLAGKRALQQRRKDGSPLAVASDWSVQTGAAGEVEALVCRLTPAASCPSQSRSSS
jgi:PAS domain S-box-containing protein